MKHRINRSEHTSNMESQSLILLAVLRCIAVTILQRLLLDWQIPVAVRRLLLCYGVQMPCLTPFHAFLCVKGNEVMRLDLACLGDTF